MPIAEQDLVGKRVAVWLEASGPSAPGEPAGFAARVIEVSLDGVHLQIEAGLDEPCRMVLPHGLIWAINGSAEAVPSDSRLLREAEYVTTWRNDDLRRKIIARAELNYQEELGRAEDA